MRIDINSTKHLPSVLLTAVPATSSYPTRNPTTIDEYTPHQYWSANFIITVSAPRTPKP